VGQEKRASALPVLLYNHCAGAGVVLFELWESSAFSLCWMWVTVVLLMTE
jgi:hypothetical protein